ncbi:MAG TPA: hypothetical protein VNA25_19490 [Phycisphaerae bacterium]|nr:hypothetical protein [Phycisphaerae bacterium]
MPKLTESDSYFGAVQAGRWNDNDRVIHVEQAFSHDGDGFEGAGMRHPRHVYVNMGKVLQKSPLNDGAINPTVADLAYYESDPSTALPTDMEVSTALNITVVMKNVGTSTWDNTYDLIPIGSNDFNFSPVAVTGTVAPGASAVFAMAGTSDAVVGIYSLQFQMQDGGATLFPGATALVSINVNAAASGGLWLINGTAPATVGTYSASYVVAGYDPDGDLVLVSETEAMATLPDLEQYDPKVTIDLKGRGGVQTYKLFRVASTFPAGWPEASIGAINDSTYGGNGDIAGNTVLLYDQGEAADTNDTAPSPVQVGKTAKAAENAVANPTLVMPNIIDGLLLDGTQGGEVVDGELVFDYVDSEFPLNESGWPEADWPRNIRAIISGSSLVYVRVYFADGWGNTLGVRFPVRDTFAGDENQNGYAAKRVKRIVIESVDPGTVLWLGWGAAMGVPYPVHPRPQQNDTGKSDETRGTAPWFYHPSFYRNGRELQVGSTGIQNKFQFYPIQNDPRGLWRPTDEPNGLVQYEVEYWTERLDSVEQTFWRSSKDAGLLDGIIIPEEVT